MTVELGQGRDGEELQKEDYIDENPELQKILRDLYSEPDVKEDGIFKCKQSLQSRQIHCGRVNIKSRRINQI